MCRRQRPKSCHGPISSKQPSLNDALGNGTSRSGSNEYLTPRPSHSGHIPCGLLKLKSCGLGGSNERPQWVQAYDDEKGMSPSDGCRRSKVEGRRSSLSFDFRLSTFDFRPGSSSAATIKFPFPSRSASSTA